MPAAGGDASTPLVVLALAHALALVSVVHVDFHVIVHVGAIPQDNLRHRSVGTLSGTVGIRAERARLGDERRERRYVQHVSLHVSLGDEIPQSR